MQLVLYEFQRVLIYRLRILYCDRQLWLYLVGLRFIVRVIYIISSSNSPVHTYRASNVLSSGFGSRLYGTLVFLLSN